MAIPIANIYYLLCYAWDEFAPQQMNTVDPEHFPDALHLFAHLLALGTRILHRRGWESGYIVTREPTATVRGRILVGETIQLLTRQPKKVFCEFDEMSIDVLTNQILKATMKRLLGDDNLKSSLRGDMRRCLGMLTSVTDIDLSARVFHDVHLHQNNRFYSFLINICRFCFESMEAQDRPGRYRFRDLARDEIRMRRIFEKFVRNFFSRRQRGFAVKAETLRWHATALDGSNLNLLPEMRTDVTLRSRSGDRTIVIECKFTDRLYQKQRFVSGEAKLRSAHLYQLCAYLRNLERGSKADALAEGVLLYPAARAVLDQSYQLDGHRVRIKTLDLNQPWQQIEDEMLALIEPLDPRA